MYRYNDYDKRIVAERVEQFRDQTRRFLAGEMEDEEFRALRLMNGLYLQRLAPMLRVAIPYGLLSSAQVRCLAHIARKYDKGYGHISTRQNMQYNWPKLEEVPDILAELAEVEMHAIQTSGNCIRNVTSDQLAGVAEDELEDPRPYCEIIRQWSTFHPEFCYLPRKFKIAVCGTEEDRAATKLHDIGLFLKKNEDGEIGFNVWVGGGQGRLPHIATEICPWLPKVDILSYLEAIVRVYNQKGRRDNMHRARIKILVKAMGIDAFRKEVEWEWQHIKESGLKLDEAELERIAQYFNPHAYEADAANDEQVLADQLAANPDFARWYQRNTVGHKVAGYRAAYVSLKAPEIAPGDITDTQMDVVADLADKYSFGEVRTTHNQNMLLADVRQGQLLNLWQDLQASELATANIGTLTDMICCPGLDFCSLANAGSIDVAKQINERFDSLDYLYDIGDIEVKMSGCMNACGHHHVGHIGILGVDKKGEEWYQITLGGSASKAAALGDRLGRAVAKDKVAETMEHILNVYLENREGDGETFIEAYQRLGVEPFQERVYG